MIYARRLKRARYSRDEPAAVAARRRRSQRRAGESVLAADADDVPTRLLSLRGCGRVQIINEKARRDAYIYARQRLHNTKTTDADAQTVSGWTPGWKAALAVREGRIPTRPGNYFWDAWAAVWGQQVNVVGVGE